MTVRAIKVDTFAQEHLCPECEKQNNTVTLRACGDPEPGLNNGLLFPHKCLECGFEVKLTDQYPRFHFEAQAGAEWVEVDGKKRIVVAS